MQGGACRRAKRGPVERGYRCRAWLGALAAAFALAGCVTDSRTATTGSLPPMRGGSIAFESIDGPPPDVFHSFVQALNDAASAREMAVVSREAPADYRVRGYLSVQVQRKQATVAWAWELYDSSERRMLRLTGEEISGPAGRNAWNSANEDVLRRIARDGMDQLAAYVGASGRPAAPDSAEPAPSETLAFAQSGQ